MITYLQMNSDPRNRRNQRSNGWTEEGCDELKMLKMLEMLEMPELLEMLDGHNLLSFLHSSYGLEELLQEPSPRTEQHVRRSNSAWSNFSQSKKTRFNWLCECVPRCGLGSSPRVCVHVSNRFLHLTSPYLISGNRSS